MAYIGAGISRFNTADELTVTGDAQIDGTTLVIDSTNNRVGIGTGSPSQKLSVVESSGSARMELLSGTSGTSIIDMGDTSDADIGGIRYENTNNAMLFRANNDERLRIDSSGHVLVNNTAYGANGTLVVQQTADSKGIAIIDSAAANTFFLENDGTINRIRNNASVPLTLETAGAERMRIDSSGNLLVGKTSADGGVAAGHDIRATGLSYQTVDGGAVTVLNRLTSDGDIALFRKDGTTVGSIAAKSDDLNIFSSASNHTGLRLSLNAILPTNNLGNVVDNQVDLGKASANYRFKDLYLSGGAYLGGTGSANKLDDYEEGTWTPAYTGEGSNPTISYSSQNGKYTKIGRVVMVNFYINTSSVSGGSGELRISGLPFSLASGTAAGSRTGNAQNWTSGINTNSSIGGFVNGSEIILAKNNNSRLDVTDLRTSNDSNQLWWSLSYLTDA